MTAAPSASLPRGPSTIASLLVVAALAAGCCPRGNAGAAGPGTTPEPTAPTGPEESGTGPIRSATPLLAVEAIERCLPFFVDRLGFAVTMQVPPEGPAGFAALERDGMELMLQTRASVEADLPEVAPQLVGTSVLYVEVEDLDWVLERLGEVEVLVPERITDYGMREVFVREPCGHVLGFAARAE